MSSLDIRVYNGINVRMFSKEIVEVNDVFIPFPLLCGISEIDTVGDEGDGDVTYAFRVRFLREQGKPLMIFGNPVRYWDARNDEKKRTKAYLEERDRVSQIRQELLQLWANYHAGIPPQYSPFDIGVQAGRRRLGYGSNPFNGDHPRTEEFIKGYKIGEGMTEEWEATFKLEADQ